MSNLSTIWRVASSKPDYGAMFRISPNQHLLTILYLGSPEDISVLDKVAVLKPNNVLQAP